MSEILMAVMPYSDYEGACNAIREATGKTEKIPSGQFESEVRNALASGGGGENNELLVEVVGGSVTELTVQDLEGLTEVAQRALSDRTSLSKLELPDTVTTIGIYGCQNTAITEFICPDSLTYIATGAFSSCKGLKRVVFNRNLIQLGNQVFGDCISLEELDFSQCTSIPSISNVNCFKNVPTSCIYKIPSALYEEWKAATNWSTYADYMVAV